MPVPIYPKGLREVAIIGIGQSLFGKQPERGLTEMGEEAARAAIKVARINPKKIQFVYCSNLYHPFVLGQGIASRVGISDCEVVNVENACAGGATAVRGVWYGIATGLYDIGLAVGVESMTTSPIAGKLIPPSKDDLEGQLGLTMPSFFALIMKRHMEQYGSTLEQFAKISVKNHHHGCLNPFSQYQKEFTVEEILNSRMICEPITLLACCPNTDGAAAIILCAADIAKQYTTKPIYIAASALFMGDYKHRQKDIAFSNLTYKTVHQAYEMAGIGPEDLDVIELHDPFTVAELCHYEEMGLCPKGEGGRLIEEGTTYLGGRIPVNPSGGLLAQGHPLSATGVRQVAEISSHLRGEAGARQVPDAKIGMAHVVGGTVAGLEAGACGVTILKR